MFWTFELANMLHNAPWPLTKDELIDYVNRTTGCAELLENLAELEDDGEEYDSIEDIWINMPDITDTMPLDMIESDGFDERYY